jgi:hypothetical protein
VFSRLSSLVIDGVTEQDGVIVVRAPTASWPVPLPGRGALTGQVHGLHGRTVADVPADSCPVLVRRISAMGRLCSPSLGTDGPVLVHEPDAVYGERYRVQVEASQPPERGDVQGGGLSRLS